MTRTTSPATSVQVPEMPEHSQVSPVHTGHEKPGNRLRACRGQLYEQHLNMITSHMTLFWSNVKTLLGKCVKYCGYIYASFCKFYFQFIYFFIKKKKTFIELNLIASLKIELPSVYPTPFSKGKSHFPLKSLWQQR